MSGELNSKMNSREIIKIKSTIPSNVLRLELFLSDFCNYQCWYCSKDFNGRTVKWPTLEILLPNFIHLLNFYKSKGKSKFIIHIGGGEPSQWPELVNFVLTIKKYHNCVVSLTTNGSRTLRWWNENVKTFDHIGLSVHHEKANANHLKKVGDIVYKNKVALWTSVLMDPNHWEKCISIIEELKTSKYKWSITANQIHWNDLIYTDDQKEFLKHRICRKNNIFYEWFINKRKRPNYQQPIVYFKDYSKKVKNHWLLLNNYNNFKNWECYIGIETIFIDKKGEIKGSCGNTLFDKDFFYNIYDKDFVSKFDVELIPTTCQMNRCICQPEVNCTKINLKYKELL
jgi:MoaA/NifB/PqqE/SkfB family radical SAM enzyme